MSLNIKFTDAGKAALVNPANIGTQALNITHIDLGTATYNPDGSETNLQAGFKTLSTFGADTVADDVIHVTIRDDSSDTYDLGEIGLRSGTGILLGVISTAGSVITQKGINDVLLLSADATITEVDVTNLTFGGTEFIYSPGTPTKAGILEVADQSEVDAAITNKAVDPYQLQALLTRRLTASLTDPSTTKMAAAKAVYDLNVAINNINALLVSDTATLDTLQEIVNFIELNRSDLDSLTIASIAGLQTALNAKAGASHGHAIADVSGLQTALDGKSASSHSHTWSAITSKPSTFAPSAHGHAIADVSGLQTALDGKSASSHSHAWSAITSKPSTFAPSAHGHAIADVSGLQTALDGKSASSHSHAWSAITSKPSTFTPSAHGHAIADVSGLQAALDSAGDDLENKTLVWSGSSSIISISGWADGLYLIVYAFNSTTFISALAYLHDPGVVVNRYSHVVVGESLSSGFLQIRYQTSQLSAWSNPTTLCDIKNVYRIG